MRSRATNGFVETLRTFRSMLCESGENKVVACNHKRVGPVHLIEKLPLVVNDQRKFGLKVLRSVQFPAVECQLDQPLIASLEAEDPKFL